MSYKRETLEAKTSKDLKRMCAHRLGLPGMWKKTKSEVIDAIMGKSANAPGKKTRRAAAIESDTSAPLTAIGGSFQSTITKPGEDFGFKTSTAVQVTCGANTGKFPVSGRKVTEVGELLREVFNVSKLSTGLVNGKAVDGDYVIKDGDVLEFLKPAGRKG